MESMKPFQKRMGPFFSKLSDADQLNFPKKTELSLSFAILSSLGNNSNLTCMEDGLWSFPEALCELMCRAPSVVPNADLQTARCRDDKHKVGSFCKYKCKPGYHVPGLSRKARK